MKLINGSHFHDTVVSFIVEVYCSISERSIVDFKFLINHELFSHLGLQFLGFCFSVLAEEGPDWSSKSKCCLSESVVFFDLINCLTDSFFTMYF